MRLQELFVVHLLFLTLAQSNKFQLQPKRETIRLASAVIKVIDNVWSTRQMSANIIKASENPKKFDIIDIINQISIRAGEPPIIALRIESKASLYYIPRRPKQSAVFILETFDDFKRTLEIITRTRFQFSGEFLFVLIDGKFPEIEEVFKVLWSFQIVNVNVMYEEEENGEILVETFFPFDSVKCGETTPSLINQFKQGEFINEPFFPEKLNDLQGCELRVATSNVSIPYSFAELLPNGSYYLHGRDIQLIEALSKALNFKINYVFIGEEGYLLENGTATGPFEMLLNKKADLIAADYWLKVNRLQFIDYSTPYITQQIAFIIPPGSELSSFEKFIRPLDMYTWILLIHFIGIAVLVIYVVGKMSTKFQDFVFGIGIRKPYMNILHAIFGGSQPQLPQRNFARSLLMMFLLFCLVMRTLYTGSLYRFLQSKVHHKEAQSINEMVEKDFKFYTVSSILDLLQGQSRIFQRTVVIKNMKERDELLKEISTNPKFKGALFRSYTGTLYYNQMHFNETQYVMCKEIYMTFPVVLYFPKDFYLTLVINEKISLLQAAGLIDHWHSEIIDERYTKIVESKEPKGIKLEYLSGCFWIWIVSCVLSTLTFFGEIFYEKLFDIWKHFKNLRILEVI